MKRLHTDEPGRGAGRWPSSPRGLRSWFALRGRSRSSTLLRDCRVVEPEPVSLHADRNAHGEWWSPCAFRSASSDSQQSALGTAQTSDEKAVKKERPHAWLQFGVSCGPPSVTSRLRNFHTTGKHDQFSYMAEDNFRKGHGGSEWGVHANFEELNRHYLWWEEIHVHTSVLSAEFRTTTAPLTHDVFQTLCVMCV